MDTQNERRDGLIAMIVIFYYFCHHFRHNSTVDIIIATPLQLLKIVCNSSQGLVLVKTFIVINKSEMLLF